MAEWTNLSLSWRVKEYNWGNYFNINKLQFNNSNWQVLLWSLYPLPLANEKMNECERNATLSSNAKTWMSGSKWLSGLSLLDICNWVTDAVITLHTDCKKEVRRKECARDSNSLESALISCCENNHYNTNAACEKHNIRPFRTIQKDKSVRMCSDWSSLSPTLG